MQVSVIIAVYNRANLLDELLNTWRKIDKKTKYEYELIFSDDESSDNSIEILNACKDLPIRVLKNSHGGASKARNNAYKYATGEIVIFTGDDIFPTDNFINKHYEMYLKNGENFATLGRIEWHKDIEMNHLMNHITNIGCEQFGFVGMKPYDTIDFRHFYTSNISVARKKLEELDYLFDTRFKKYGFEDIELGYRLYKNGVSIFYNPSIVCFHNHIYDSVGKFCIRQLSAGEELNTFKTIHPELRADEIKIDIDEFNNALEKFMRQKKRFNFISDSIVIAISISKYLTIVLEKLMKKIKSKKIEKICSLFYTWIFNYSMYQGLALGNKNVKNINKRDAGRFAVNFLFFGMVQIFFDKNNNFSEENSIKYHTFGQKKIKIEYLLKNNEIRRIRLDPLDNTCKIKNLFAEAILAEGKKMKIEFQYTNANYQNNEYYDFSKIYDPIIISESLPKNTVSIKISYEIKYLKVKRIIKVLYKLIKIIKNTIIKKVNYKKNMLYKNTKGIQYNNLKKKVWIYIKYEDDDICLKLDEYKKICSMLDDVIISNKQCEDSNYRGYTYCISKLENAMENSQFLNSVYCLYKYNYDYIVVSDNLEYFPKVFWDNSNDCIIISDRFKNVEELSIVGVDAIGRYIRIPGSKRISNTIDFKKVISNTKCIDINKLILGKGKKIHFNSNSIITNLNKSKPIILILPVFMAVGGVERNTVEVMSKLKDIYDFVVVTFEKHRPEQGSLYYQIADELAVAYLDLAEIAEFDNYLNILCDIKKMYKPDLIWICNSSPWFMDNCSDIRRIFDEIPIVDQDVYDYKYGWINYYDRPGVQSYDRFIAVNQKIKEKFINKYSINEKDIDLVYSAIDTKKILDVEKNNLSREEILAKFELDSNKKYFTFIGRFTEQKQTHKVVELANYAINKYGQDINFIMVGDGELSDSIDKLIKKYNMEDRIHRIKYIANTVEFLKAMDGIVITSIFEGLPIVTIEAMCIGTPILATNVGDLALFVDTYEIGVISKTQEMFDIKIAFDKFLSNLNLYKNNTKKSRKKNIEFFSSDRAAKLMNNSFEKAISKYNMEQESELKK